MIWVQRREFITFISGAAAWPLAARAQQPGKIYRIGVFTAGAPIRSKTWSILIDALKELGWTEGNSSRGSRTTTSIVCRSLRLNWSASTWM